MKTLLIALMFPIALSGQELVMDTTLKIPARDSGRIFFSDTKSGVTYYWDGYKIQRMAYKASDTLEATIFMNNLLQPVSDKIIAAFPIVGYVVVVPSPVPYGADPTAVRSLYRIICYLDHRKRLINTNNVYDYKLREK